MLLALSAIAPLTGCASLGTKPWDRDLLATKAMALNTHPHITAADDHIYFSKEGSTGGRGFEGGGCGCN
ncbi:hypothetical protein ABENE_21350 [Asticcacaulis benevestitus DSM 16100 = ATCC BAA-896]|uniref:DUF4266 domain-containing protein n=1 Tax=Asticcacaulis benevestitus DSM 16100 = ATCC BAA-896 TaxID=1121022 RepID=V4P400_9CAUL|nr:hypothetical protein ABENE_21350 [Asticcacaulis benevestitus DSM 16100 = ATCC BAA-896]